MDWCKLSAGYYRDAAVIRAGEAAEVMFLRGLAYCAEHDTGGLIETQVLPFLCPTKTKQRADALSRELLWLAVPGGYQVRTWDIWQEAADVAAERRRKDAERKRAERQAKASTDSPRTVHGQSEGRPVNVPAQSKSKKEELEEELKATTASAPRQAASIADSYVSQVPLSRRSSVYSVVLQALKTEQWPWSEVNAAVARLAAQDMSVTTETLRHELNGMKPRQRAGPDARVSATLALAEKFRAQEALEPKEIAQ